MSEDKSKIDGLDEAQRSYDDAEPDDPGDAPEECVECGSREIEVDMDSEVYYCPVCDAEYDFELVSLANLVPEEPEKDAD